MEMVHLKSLQHYENLPLNEWNIKQPSDQEQLKSVFDIDALDLVIVPGLGFTVDGKRLGRGKGYYDKFLDKCFKKFGCYPYTIGIAFEEQIFDDIPVTENDVKLNEVIYA